MPKFFLLISETRRDGQQRRREVIVPQQPRVYFFPAPIVPHPYTEFLPQRPLKPIEIIRYLEEWPFNTVAQFHFIFSALIAALCHPENINFVKSQLIEAYLRYRNKSAAPAPIDLAREILSFDCPNKEKIYPLVFLQKMVLNDPGQLRFSLLHLLAQDFDRNKNLIREVLEYQQEFFFDSIMEQGKRKILQQNANGTSETVTAFEIGRPGELANFLQKSGFLTIPPIGPPKARVLQSRHTQTFFVPTNPTLNRSLSNLGLLGEPVNNGKCALMLQ